MLIYYGLAQDYGEMFCLLGLEGRGKTFVAEWYRDRMRGKNVFYLRCKSVHNKKYFLIDILKSMGKPYEGMNTFELMEACVYQLSRMEKPLIILMKPINCLTNCSSSSFNYIMSFGLCAALCCRGSPALGIGYAKG